MIPSELTIRADELAYAQRYYREQGFVETPTPWLVSRAAYMTTCPEEVSEIHHEWQAPDGQLYHVASAEQGFVQLMLDGTALPERAQSTSPCFRWESTFDAHHLPYFYKVELYDKNTSHFALASMLALAKQLFGELGITAHIQPMEDGSYDLVSPSGLELGSYGVRRALGFSWTYGTGIAFPRFDNARDNYTNR